MLRILGALCILIGAGAAGFGFAASVRRQARQLGELCTALESMRCEIEYRMTPLPQLLEQLAQTCVTPVGELLLHWARMLSDGDGATVSYALRRAMESVHGLELPSQAVQELTSLSVCMGRFDAAGQARSVALAAERLRLSLAELEAGKRARCRSYRTIGICAGLALAVILL